MAAPAAIAAPFCGITPRSSVKSLLRAAFPYRQSNLDSSVPNPAHNRLLSNDYARLKPLEPKRRSRGKTTTKTGLLLAALGTIAATLAKAPPLFSAE